MLPDDSFQNKIPILYQGFDAPITHLDCGKKCAPYNENGVPFCCDTHHAVPTAYLSEWEYLRHNTDLWHLWQGPNEHETEELQAETPVGQVLIECKGHEQCQRTFRSLTCRAFPFFPYISREKKFLGLSVYWEYMDRCWVISNLDQVTQDYLHEFVSTFEQLFVLRPQEFDNFYYHSVVMRRIFGRRHRAIPLLHRNGNVYQVTPRNGRMRRTAATSLPKYGPYAVAANLPFRDEISEPNLP